MPDKKRTALPTDEEIDVMTAAIAALPSGVECAALVRRYWGSDSICPCHLWRRIVKKLGTADSLFCSFC